MNILLENTIRSVKFDNPEHTMISVILQAADGTNFEYNIDALDREHEDFTILTGDLGWTTEVIARETHEINKANYTLFKQAMRAEYKLEIEQQLEALTEQLTNQPAPQATLAVDIMSLVMDNNTDEDLLFKFKLDLFDIPEVSKLSKAGKTKIRQAKSLMELFGAVSNVEWGKDT